MYYLNSLLNLVAIPFPYCFIIQVLPRDIISSHCLAKGGVVMRNNTTEHFLILEKQKDMLYFILF